MGDKWKMNGNSMENKWEIDLEQMENNRDMNGK